MTVLQGRTIRWMLSGGTFLLIVAMAGCATQGPVAPTADATGAQATPVQHDPFEAKGSEATVVNVFGEFNGVERPAIQPVGDNAFQQHTFLEDGYDSSVTVDPAGKCMVYSSTRHSEHADIYLQRVDGMTVTQLTNDGADDAFPSFSPDGKTVAFCSTRAGSWNIYTMDIDGKNVVQVTSGPAQDMHPSFSPDGSRLVYCSLGSRSGQWELWLVNLANGQKKMIGYGLFPVWSPAKDADRIAFQRARQRGSRWFSLWTLDLVDGEARRQSEIAVSANAAIVSPAWSPDGKRLAFGTIVEPATTAGLRPQSQQDIWTINIDGTNRQRLTDGIGTNLTPFWASDNRVYFVSNRSGAECVWSVRAAENLPAVAADKNHNDKTQDRARTAVGVTDPAEPGN